MLPNSRVGKISPDCTDSVADCFGASDAFLRRDELDYVAGDQQYQITDTGYNQNYPSSSSANGYDIYGTTDYGVGGSYAENPYYTSHGDNNRNYDLVGSDVKSYAYGGGV